MFPRYKFDGYDCVAIEFVTGSVFCSVEKREPPELAPKQAPKRG